MGNSDSATQSNSFRCYHCNEVFSGEAALEHFGDKIHAVPTKCQQAASDSRMFDAMIVELERYGIHRNHHNAASIKQLWDMAEAKGQARVREAYKMTESTRIPDPNHFYLCPYCDMEVRLSDPEGTTDKYRNVCHKKCLLNAWERST